MTIPRHKFLGEKLKLGKFFFIEHVCMNLLGFDLSSKKVNTYGALISMFAGLCIFFTMIGMAHYGWQHIDDLEMVTDAAGPLIQCVLVLWKFIIFTQKYRKLLIVIHEIFDLIEKANELELEIVSLANKSNLRWSYLYTYFAGLASSSALVTPFIAGIGSYYTTGKYMYKAPLTATYPFSVDRFSNFLVVFLLSGCGIVFVVYVTVGIDCLYAWCVNNVAAQFQVVQHKLKTLSHTTSTTSKSNRFDALDDDVYGTLIVCIEYHQRIIVLANELNRAFRLIALAEFTLNSTQLCFIVYQIGRGLDATRIPFLILFMLTILAQLLLYAHAGQQLENESENVAVVCYKNLQWEFWSNRVRKMLLLSILRAQRSCKVSAIFFVINMRLFVWVLQTSLSYIALLWSVK